MSDLTNLHERIESLEHTAASLIDCSNRLTHLLPSLATLIEDLDRVTKSLSTARNEDENTHRRRFPLLIEEVRVLLEEVESEVDSLESQINVIESLQNRVR